MSPELQPRSLVRSREKLNCRPIRWYSEDTDGANGKTDRPNSNLDQAVVKEPVPVRAVGLRRCSEAVEQAIWTRPRILLRIGFGGVYHRSWANVLGATSSPGIPPM
jgi:hypothetical protein